MISILEMMCFCVFLVIVVLSRKIIIIERRSKSCQCALNIFLSGHLRTDR